MPDIRIPYNRAAYLGTEDAYLREAMQSRILSGQNRFGRECEAWFERWTGSPKALMTSSCTAALEMAALLLDLGPGDEVVMPSFTFVSTANAFVLRGATIRFVDIDPVTMNLDPEALEQAITAQTRAVVVVHYAGVVCDMRRIQAILEDRSIVLIEDAAQAHLSSRHGQTAGSFGALAAFSFHETKNITSGGEGGMLCVNDPALVQRAEIIRDKGTNRLRYFRGEVDKYEWVDLGSSYLASELQAAYLAAQLAELESITAERLQAWQRYARNLAILQNRGLIDLPAPPPECVHNGHVFFIKTTDAATRSALIDHLHAAGIYATFHYVPLHSAPAGKIYGSFSGEDRHTTAQSLRLLRLPIFHGISDVEIDEVTEAIYGFYESVPTSESTPRA